MSRPSLPESGSPLNLAHRGGAGLWPENTLFAFKNAARLGADVIETDVHCTRDGHLVLCHDTTVDRTTDGSGPVASHSLRELQELDAAHHFELGSAGIYPLRGKGLQVPTLKESLAALPEMRFNIDIKSGAQTPQLLADALQDQTLAERVMVASASYSRISRFRRLTRRRIPTSASGLEVLLFWLIAKLRLPLWSKPAFSALQVPTAWGLLSFLSPAFLAAAARRGLAVHYWTLNDKSRIEQALQGGAKGVVTDFPDLLQSVIEQHVHDAALPSAD